MYVVNGSVVPDIDHIAQEDIESIDHLPADDETIAKWGLEASEGVIIVTLRYDTPALFNAGEFDNFTSYLAKNVRWSENLEPERVSLRIVVDQSGRASISQVLQASRQSRSLRCGALQCVMARLWRAPISSTCFFPRARAYLSSVE